MAWKRLVRKTIYKTPHIEVFEDTVEVAPGVIVDDYSLVTFKDGIIVVATDEDNQLIVIDEYKYGADEVRRITPCGSLDTPDEDPLQAALRELKEETGYTATDATVIRPLREYSSKLTHQTHVVRVKNARKTDEPKREVTEGIENVELISKEEALRPGAFSDAAVVAAIFWTLAQE